MTLSPSPPPSAPTRRRPAADPEPAPSGTAPAPSSLRVLARQLVATFPEAVRKLDPRHVWRSPVVFVVWVGSLLTTVVAVIDPTWFAWSITLWLWATVLFANMAEAVAEGRGKAQAATLRATRTTTTAQRRRADRSLETVAASELTIGDVVVVRPGEVIPRRRRHRGHGHRRRVRHHRESAPSSASPVVTARPSPAARRCCPTASRCASRRSPARRSSTG